MPGSKSGPTCLRTRGHENDRTVNWCKHICRLTNPRTTDPEYKAWQEAVLYKMQQHGIPTQELAMPEQWTAIQAYGLSLDPWASNSRAAHWQQDKYSGLHFTECYDYLLRDIVNKHSRTYALFGIALPPAVPPAPALAGNNGKFRPLIVRINQHVKRVIWCCRF